MIYYFKNELSFIYFLIEIYFPIFNLYINIIFHSYNSSKKKNLLNMIYNVIF